MIDADLKETQTTATALPIACNLGAIEPDKRAAHVLNAQALFGLAHTIRELEDGVEIVLSGDGDTLGQAAQFIAHERACCPFFTFTLQVRATEAPFYLRLTGGAGVKEFLRAEFGDKLGLTFEAGRRSDGEPI